MLVENKGIRTDRFYVPPFELKAGEIVVLCLFHGQHFYDSAMMLKDIFTGNAKNDNVIIHKKLTFIEYFREPKLRSIFYPVTVKEYLKKNAGLNSPYTKKIYENKWINEKTKVQTLAWNPRKLLSLYATFSKTKDIIFDLIGLDPMGADTVYAEVKEAVRNGGAAILLDGHSDMKDDCTKYIEVEWDNNKY
jgi:hypothetical protein